MNHAIPGIAMHTMNPSGTTRLFIIFLMAQTLLLSQGCAPLMTSRSPSKWMWWKKQDEPRTPNKVTPMWTDTVMYQSGMAPVRGFGGRVMFFDGKSETPVKVEGSLTVYAFDGTAAESSGTVPERKFVFPAEELEKHYSESKLGPSYSFWLPWDEVGGYERRVTLITRFEPKEGGPTMSQPSRHYLPGLPAPEKRELADQSKAPAGRGSLGAARHPVQAASFTDAPIDPTIYPRMSTVTIDVPPSFVRHTHGDPLDHLRQQLVQPHRDITDSRRPGPIGRWWEQAESGNMGERNKRESNQGERNEGERKETLDHRESGSEALPKESGAEPRSDELGQGNRTFQTQRREQIRRQPHQAHWIPALSPTPRAAWARNVPDRWPTEN